MNKEKEKIKPITIRLPKALWFLLKQASAEQEKAMSQIVCDSLQKTLENKSKKGLTINNTVA